METKDYKKPIIGAVILLLVIIVVATVRGVFNTGPGFGEASMKDTVAGKNKIIGKLQNFKDYRSIGGGIYFGKSTQKSDGQTLEWGHIISGDKAEVFGITKPEDVASGEIIAQMKAMLQEGIDSAESPFPITVPVNFHIITDSNGKGEVDQSSIERQITLLNEHFSGNDDGSHHSTGFQFVLNEVYRQTSDDWFYNCLDNYETVAEAVNTKSNVDTSTTINVITCEPGDNILGLSSMPWYWEESSKKYAIFLWYEALPGEAVTNWMSNYNGGDTLTHEMGHYLGLEHTFGLGYACENDDDGIADTPLELSASSGACPANDSCPNDEGMDPIKNYMDYTYDSCMNEFTEDQDNRMMVMTTLFRPSLLGL